MVYGHEALDYKLRIGQNQEGVETRRPPPEAKAKMPSLWRRDSPGSPETGTNPKAEVVGSTPAWGAGEKWLRRYAYRRSHFLLYIIATILQCKGIAPFDKIR